MGGGEGKGILAIKNKSLLTFQLDIFTSKNVKSLWETVV
jgi:hypothetical protein